MVDRYTIERCRRMYEQRREWIESATQHYSRNTPTGPGSKASGAPQAPCARVSDTCARPACTNFHPFEVRFAKYHDALDSFYMDLAKFHDALVVIFNLCLTGDEKSLFFGCALDLGTTLADKTLTERARASMEAPLAREKDHMLAVLHAVRQAVQNYSHNYEEAAAAARVYKALMVSTTVLTSEFVPVRFRDLFTDVLAEACEIRELMLEIANRGVLPHHVAKEWATVLSLHPTCEHPHYTHPFVPYCRAEDVAPLPSGGTADGDNSAAHIPVLPTTTCQGTNTRPVSRKSIDLFV